MPVKIYVVFGFGNVEFIHILYLLI